MITSPMASETTIPAPNLLTDVVELMTNGRWLDYLRISNDYLCMLPMASETTIPALDLLKDVVE